MEETVKKTKAPAKPRKAAAKKGKVTEMAASAPAELAAVAAPSREEIARLAWKFWAERGWRHGHAEHDWLRAERELQGMAS